MSLTIAQLQILKTNIGTNFPSVPNTSDANFDIAEAYSAVASPNFYVWRTNLSKREINEVVDWNEIVNMTVPELISFQLFKDQDFLDVSKASIRQAFISLFATKPNTSANLVTAAKRLATRIEKLFSTGTGSFANPATMSFEGQISYSVVESARNL